MISKTYLDVKSEGLVITCQKKCQLCIIDITGDFDVNVFLDRFCKLQSIESFRNSSHWRMISLIHTSPVVDTCSPARLPENKQQDTISLVQRKNSSRDQSCCQSRSNNVWKYYRQCAPSLKASTSCLKIFFTTATQRLVYSGQKQYAISGTEADFVYLDWC